MSGLNIIAFVLINILQVVTAINYDTIAALHNLQSLHTDRFYLHYSSRTYHTAVITVSLNYALQILQIYKII
jgi:hypothetical protein